MRILRAPIQIIRPELPVYLLLSVMSIVVFAYFALKTGITLAPVDHNATTTLVHYDGDRVLGLRVVDAGCLYHWPVLVPGREYRGREAAPEIPPQAPADWLAHIDTLINGEMVKPELLEGLVDNAVKQFMRGARPT